MEQEFDGKRAIGHLKIAAASLAYSLMAMTTDEFEPQQDENGGCQRAGGRSIIVARVALGDPFLTTSALGEKERRPPERPHHAGGGAYDNVIANPGPMEKHHRGHQDHQELDQAEGGQERLPPTLDHLPVA